MFFPRGGFACGLGIGFGERVVMQRVLFPVEERALGVAREVAEDDTENEQAKTAGEERVAAGENVQEFHGKNQSGVTTSPTRTVPCLVS